MIVSFEDPVLGDAADELEHLGNEFACDVLLYLQKVHSGAVSFRSLAPFYTYQGVEMFQASTGNKFTVFSVEIDNAGDVKITVMLAGTHGISMKAGSFSWDGNDYRTLRTGILAARASAWFV